MARIGTFEKQPNEVLDYDIDCADWLATGDNIVGITATSDVPAELVVDLIVNNDPQAKIWLSGGVDGTTYQVEASITTGDGRKKEAEFVVRVKEI